MGDTSVSSDKQEITLATDCSGMELAPKILEQMGYKVRSLWVSETSEHAPKPHTVRNCITESQRAAETQPPNQRASDNTARER